MEHVENPMINYKEEEPQVVAICLECNERLTEIDDIVIFGHDYFCSDECLFKYYDIKKKEGWELNEG